MLPRFLILLALRIFRNWRTRLMKVTSLIAWDDTGEQLGIICEHISVCLGTTITQEWGSNMSSSLGLLFISWTDVASTDPRTNHLILLKQVTGCYTIWAGLWYTVPSWLYCTVQYCIDCTVLYYTAVLYYAILYCAVLFCTVSCGAIWYCTVIMMMFLGCVKKYFCHRIVVVRKKLWTSIKIPLAFEKKIFNN